MRAVIAAEFNAEPELADLPVPDPGEGEVLVRLAAAGVNPFDFKVVEGAMRSQVDHQFPLVMGSDGAGTVERVGEGVTDFAPGDRVFGQFMDVRHGRGSFAEQSVTGASKLAPLPESIPFDVAAALPTASSAAHDFVEGSGIQSGQTLLINGASGGVGQSAVQLAAAKGARVIATTDAETAGYLREIGATELVDFTEGPTEDQVRLAHPNGVDAIVDLISTPGHLDPVAALLKYGGTIVSSNGAADVQALDVRGLKGLNLFADANPRTLAKLADSVTKGELKIRIDNAAPLAEAPAALERLKAGKARGKTVLSIQE